MKTLVISGLLLAFMAITPARAQKFADMDKSPLDIAMLRGQDKAPLVRVIYSRPAMHERKIFGTEKDSSLVPYDKVWRTGANESTEIKLYKDMMIGDKKVEAGTYTLFTIPGEKEWTVILNKDNDTWGAFGYKEERDQVRIKTPARKTSASIEDFSIVFEPEDGGGSDMLMGWDDTYVKVPFAEAEM